MTDFTSYTVLLVILYFWENVIELCWFEDYKMKVFLLCVFFFFLFYYYCFVDNAHNCQDLQYCN